MNEENANPGLDADLKLIGQVTALRVIVLALIESHPDPAKLASSLDRLSERGIALLLPAECRDAIVEAYQDVTGSALQLAQQGAAKTGR